MSPYDALPNDLYEILNCAIAATAAVALTICLRYLATEFHNIRGLMRLRLALGLTVFLFGETSRMTWVWLARYLANVHGDPAWMGRTPWVLVPIAGSALCVLGLAWLVRALSPAAWGRWGYVVALSAAALAVVGTQLVR